MSRHILYYSYHPLPLIFVQVMVFCNIDCANLIEIEVKPTHTLVSFVAY
jgi:hypothetical protein